MSMGLLSGLDGVVDGHAVRRKTAIIASRGRGALAQLWIRWSSFPGKLRRTEKKGRPQL